MFEIAIQLLVFISIISFFIFFLIKDEEEIIWASTFFSANKRSIRAKVRELEGKLTFMQRYVLTAHESGSTITPIEYLMLCITAGALSGIIGFILTNYIPSLLVAGCAGLILPHIYYKWKRDKRAKLIAHQFAPFMRQMANYLRCGNSRLQAFEKLLGSLEDPLYSIIAEIVAKIHTGESMVNALDQIRDRVPLFEFRMFIILVKIHAEIGGNLADSLDNLSMTIDEKKKLRDAVEAMTNETKISAYITGVIPVIMFLLFKLMAPQYMDQLTSNDAGKFGLMLSFVFIGLGIYLTRRSSMVRVDSYYN